MRLTPQASPRSDSLIFRKEEMVLCVMIAVCLGLCLRAGGDLDLPRMFQNYLQFIAAQTLGLLGILGIAAFALKRSVRSFSGIPKKALSVVFGERDGWSDLGSTYHEILRGILVFAISLAAYTSVKVRLPLLNAEVGDPWFCYLDQIFFGDMPQWLESWASQRPRVAEFLSKIYFGGYRGIVILLVFLVIRHDSRSIRVLCVSMAMTYLACILITLVYPSLGPCFFDRERFGWIQDPIVIEKQELLLRYRNHVMASVESGLGFEPSPFLGIAAFPSLHVGNLIVVAVVSMRYCRLALPFVLYYLLFTMLAATSFGWQYMIDYVGGAVVAIGCTAFCDKIVPDQLNVRGDSDGNSQSVT